MLFSFISIPFISIPFISIPFVLTGGVLLLVGGIIGNKLTANKHKIKHKLNDFKRLHNAVTLQHPNKHKIKTLLISLKIISIMYSQQILNSLNIKRDPVLITDSINRGLGKGVYYEYEYNLLGKNYKQIIKYKKGPRAPISVVYDNDYNDITDKFMSYLGLNSDFSGIKLTPKFFETNRITIVYHDETQKEIEDNEIINV